MWWMDISLKRIRLLTVNTRPPPLLGEIAFNLYFDAMEFAATSPSTPDVFSVLEKAFENLFSRILYLGPLREHPRHRYTWDGDHPKGIGQDGKKAISALLSGRVRHFFY